MKTLLTDSPFEAAEFIRRGGVVAFPTETVYGLGADIFDEAAVRKIFEAKRRPADNPLIAHVGSLEEIGRLVSGVPPAAEALIAQFFPGPLTLVMPKAAAVPGIATAGLETIGVRMPSLSVTSDFLKACGTPVVAPSANVSGRPSPTTWQAVLEDLEGRIDCILKGDPSSVGLESTVVDCTGDVPVMLRPGAVSLEALRAAVPETRERGESDDLSKSPGMRHRHYSPKADVEVFEPGTRLPENAAFAYIGLSRAPEGAVLSRRAASVEEYARGLFEFFRECDREGIVAIICEAVPETGIGKALMDRIRRAAE